MALVVPGERPPIRVAEARASHEAAFATDPILAGRITPENHPHNGHVYRAVEQTPVENCPLCGRTGEPHWVFNMVTNHHFNAGFHPVRTWRRCGDCHHLYADARPVHLGEVLRGPYNEQYGAPALNLLPYYGDILARLRALLRPGGVVWISTPNFDSAFSRLIGDRDPMKRVCEHLNYFSERSLAATMAAHGLVSVDYRISAHYNGSMEVIGARR